MDTIYKVLLGIHVAGGFTALVIGIIAYIVTKGGRHHKLAGKIYFGGMMLVVISAVSMHLIKSNTFLFYIALFTLYQIYGGTRSVKNKNLQPKILDVLMFLTGLVIAILMILTLKIVLIVFGVLFISLLYSDLKIFLLIRRKREVPGNAWLMRHIGLMSGSYIATSTAFLVVNLQHFDPFWLPWLLPSMIGVPLIIYFQKRFISPKFTRV